MRAKFNETMTKVGAPPIEFWENDLELGIEDILRRIEGNGILGEWVQSLDKRRTSVLCQNLGLNQGNGLDDRRAALSECNGTLTPYLLVAHFGRGKSHAAIEELACRSLPSDVVDACRVNEERHDILALLFALFRHDAGLLREVFHLDKIHRTGFARMTMATEARKPEKHSFQEFLRSAGAIQGLGVADDVLRDGQTSEMRDVIELDDRLLVFVRRGERPEHIVRDNQIVHGHRPEWIILDFESGAKRVNIASKSINESLEIANQLASGYFGKAVEYANETELTYSKQLERLLNRLCHGEDNTLEWVEMLFANSPLDGAPKLKIAGLTAIGPAVRHFETAVGGLLGHLDCIESIKVRFAKKRVSIIFEREEEHEEDEFVVRYSDHRLNVFERRKFENYMRDEYGIPVLSTEKRFKKEL